MDNTTFLKILEKKKILIIKFHNINTLFNYISNNSQ